MSSAKTRPKYRVAIGEAIRSRRKALHVSQEKFAERAGVHRNYIGLVERGEKDFRLSSLRKIAHALDCPASTILKEAGV